MDILKISIICIISAFFCVILKQKNQEYSLFIAVFCSVLILSFSLNSIAKPISLIQQKITELGIEYEYFKIALKALGIGYVANFAADICRDAGQTSLSTIAELAGRFAIFLLSLPLIISVCDIALGFIK